MVADSPKFYVLGSHGQCVVDAKTGEVLYIEEDGHRPNDCEYETIMRFDVDEWRAAYPRSDLVGISVDILDLGYTLRDGAYEAPQLDWRAEFRAMREGEI